MVIKITARGNFIFDTFPETLRRDFEAITQYCHTCIDYPIESLFQQISAATYIILTSKTIWLEYAGEAYGITFLSNSASSKLDLSSRLGQLYDLRQYLGEGLQ